MDNRIKSVLFGLAALAATVFLAVEIGAGNWLLPALSFIGIFALAIVLFIGKECPFDGAILCMLIAGIWITGKGAVFISVGSLVYISEVILAALLIGYAVRVSLKIWPILPPVSLAAPIILFLCYGVIHIFIDIRTFGFMTLRDACIVYYSGFFLAAYQLANNHSSFPELFKKMAIFGAVGALVVASVSNFGGSFLIFRLRDLLTFGTRSLFAPHPDASDSVLIGLMVFLVFAAISSKRHNWLAFLASLFCLLVVLVKFKGALMVGLLAAFVYLALAGQWWFFRRLAFVAICVAVIIAAMTEYYPDQTPDSIESIVSEVSSAFSPFAEKRRVDETGDDKTAAWRLAWWSWIIRETWITNPLYGLGLGRDLAIIFHEEYFGQSHMADQSAVRGAHSSMFTILGRTGIIGLIFFLWITGLQAWYVFRAAMLAKKMGGKAPIELTLYAGYLCGMVGSTFFQYGWDAPYSAIPLWTCLALLSWRVNTLECEFAREVKPNSLSQPLGWRNRPLLAGAATDG